MTCDVKTNGAKIEDGWGKILLPQIFYSARLFDLSGNGRSVISGDLKFFDSNIL